MKVRTPIEFNEYRAWYYFFQYQFYVRSKQGAIRNAPTSRISQFLINLVIDSYAEHYRWETPARCESKRSKKKKLDSDPIPVGAGNTKLYKSKKKSIRQRFMLFNFPDRHRADHIPLLYKSLLVFDMLQDGLTEYAVTKLLVSQKETLPSISRLRAQSKWYDQLFDNNIGKFEWSEITDGRAIEKYPIRVMGTNLNENASLLRGERVELHNPVRSRVSDVRRYLKIAEVLIQLAQSSNFNTFSSKIASIK